MYDSIRGRIFLFSESVIEYGNIILDTFLGSYFSLGNRVKKYFKEGKIFKAIIWAIITLIVFFALDLFREYTMQQKREEWRKEFQNSAIQFDKNNYRVLINYENISVKNVI